jgi:hypothetical protein
MNWTGNVTRMEEMKMYTKFGESLQLRDHLEDTGIDREANIIGITDMQCDNMDWLWGQWRTLVETVTKIRVPEMMGNLLTC